MESETEGIIKFNCNLIEEAPPIYEQINELILIRNVLYKYDLIGCRDGIGFGNVSKRLSGNIFAVSGSGSGCHDALINEDFSIVSDFDIENNSITCKGIIKASSESLTHAALYKSVPEINYIIHIHNLQMWDFMIAKNYMSLSSNADYGTVQTAIETIELAGRINVLPDGAVMKGHREGILFFGRDIKSLRLFIENIYKEAVIKG